MRTIAIRLAAAAAAAVTLCAGLVAAAGASSASPSSTVRLLRVVDGDTIEIAGGQPVRLLQIDAPEPGSGECYSRAAARDLRRLLPTRSTLTLERDPRLDDRDAYGRLLRYVWRGGVNVNVRLVRDGSATVWLFRGERGKYAARLLAEARVARGAKRGLWGACPRAVWNPYGAAVTDGAPSSASGAAGAGTGSGAVRPVAGGSCDPSYPDVCIPPAPPDLDCADVPHTSFRVRPPDPHRFDGEGDGLGCES